MMNNTLLKKLRTTVIVLLGGVLLTITVLVVFQNNSANDREQQVADQQAQTERNTESSRKSPAEEQKKTNQEADQELEPRGEQPEGDEVGEAVTSQSSGEEASGRNNLPSLFNTYEPESGEFPGDETNKLTVRKRYVTVNLSELNAGQNLSLPLFDNVEIETVLNPANSSSFSNLTTWKGTIDGTSVGNVILTVTSDNNLVGQIRKPGQGLYEVKHVKDDVHKILEIDESRVQFPENPPKPE